MVEYIYNTIKASAGEAVELTARITDELGKIVQTDCSLKLYQDGNEIATIQGAFASDFWTFLIPEELALKGKFEYAFFRGEKSLDFKNAIYFE